MHSYLGGPCDPLCVVSCGGRFLASVSERILNSYTTPLSLIRHSPTPNIIYTGSSLPTAQGSQPGCGRPPFPLPFWGWLSCVLATTTTTTTTTPATPSRRHLTWPGLASLSIEAWCLSERSSSSSSSRSSFSRSRRSSKTLSYLLCSFIYLL